MSERWPKPWDEITPDRPDGMAVVAPKVVDLGPIRIYDGTVYIAADGGHDTEENRDLWLPLGVYLTDSPEVGE